MRMIKCISHHKLRELILQFCQETTEFVQISPMELASHKYRWFQVLFYVLCYLEIAGNYIFYKISSYHFLSVDNNGVI